MQAILQHGKRIFRLSDPSREIQRSRYAEDVMTESWFHEVPNLFLEGQQHPEFPGLIIDEVREREIFPNRAYVSSLTAIGDSRGTKPTKVVQRGESQTLDIGWDEFQVEYLTWLARWRDCTAVASTEVFSCAGHGYANGQKVVFRALTGGAGITPMSATSRGVVYYVIAVTPTTFQISATLGGSALNVTTNLTAGQVCAAEFVKGHVHPDYPNMYAVDVQRMDRNTDWQRVMVRYRGMMEAKPYKRIISCNGQTMSSGEPIIWDFPDGWASAANSSVNLPKIVCTDTYLTTDALATDEIPYSQSEGATPPDPPDIRSISVFGTPDRLTFHWPNGWSRVDEGHVDSIPLAGVNLKKRVTEYVWPITIR